MNGIVEVIDSVEVMDPIDDIDRLVWKTGMTATTDTEWSFLQNGAKTAFYWVAFGVSKVAFWGVKSGFFTFSNGHSKKQKTIVFARKT